MCEEFHPSVVRRSPPDRLLRGARTMETTRCALTALLLLVACDVDARPERTEAPADSAAGEVDFELVGPNDAALVVPVTINGVGPFHFVLDTGATLTCVDDALAGRLDLPDAAGAAFGAGVGGQGRVRLVEIDSIAVGAAAAHDMTACALDLSGMEQVGVEIDGLLGLNFLQSFRVTLDFERGVLILR